MPYSIDEFYEVFKWDSIFRPSYQLVGMVEEGDHLIASVGLESVRNRFLKNDRMTCSYKITFSSDKISKIESLDCMGADWASWEQERDSLVNWIKLNHPELDGQVPETILSGQTSDISPFSEFG